MMDDFDLSGLIDDFLEDSRATVEKIDGLLLELEREAAGGGEVNAEIYHQLLSFLHTLKGNSGMMGYESIERYIHNSETILKMLREGEAQYDAETINILLEISGNLAEAFAEIERDSKAHPQLDNQITMLAALIMRFETALEEAEAGFVSEKESTKADEPAKVAEPSAEKPKEEIVVKASKQNSVIINDSSAKDQGENDIGNEADDAGDGAENFDHNSDSGGSDDNGGDGSSKPLYKADARYLGSSSNIIRVDFTRLDQLLNLLGELVIHRTRLGQLVTEFAETNVDPEFSEQIAETSGQIGSIINDLQDGIMQVRMLPIGQVFSRFTRLVRDLAREHGKMIDLKIEGNDVELDKKIIDKVAEPLLHMIRNSADHGIEKPDVRRKAGKPATGTITLSARQESNQIIIEVADDGGGIDRKQVRQKAVRLGLVRRDEELDEAQIIDLIFSEGFSTRDVANETSGRGIGADVVLKVIGQLGGMVTVSTEEGKGTVFKITLPLTLAIVAAMLIERSDQTYAIPLSTIVETIKVKKKDVLIVNGCEVIDLRGEIIPLLRLEKVFDLPDPKQKEVLYIVIIGTAEKNVGIVCDHLLGQQEIVIKSLDDYFGGVFGISGATILGTGDVILILDSVSLVRYNVREGRAIGSG